MALWRFMRGLIWLRLADVLLRVRCIGLSAWALSKASREGPQVPTLWRMLGEMESYRGRHQEAAEAFRKLTELAVEDERALGCLGRELTRAGRENDAVAALQKADALRESGRVGTIRKNAPSS